MQSDDTVRIPLRARDGSVRAYALIDAADANWANQWRWSLNGNGYARRGISVNGHQRKIYLHCALMGVEYGDGRQVDHLDRNRLNCRRKNLRVESGPANSQNVSPRQNTSSKYRGVSWYSPTGKWRAYVGMGGRFISLGHFATEIEAHEAACEGRRILLPYAID
jgi:hypothetical protein